MIKKTILLCLTVACFNTFSQNIEHIENKYQSKIDSVEKKYRSSMIKLKKLMIADLNSALKKALTKQDLETANSIKELVNNLNNEIKKLSEYSSAKGVTKRLNFDTATGFHDTQISVAKGQKIKFSIIGKWKPNGDNKLDGDGINVPSWSHHNYIKAANHGKVIAYISGDSKKFYEIGKKGTIKAESSGKIFIGVNDKDTNNNSGTLKAIISY